MSNLFGPRQKQSLLIFLFLLGGMVYWSTREKMPDEKQIQAAINAMIEGAEHKDLDPFSSHIADDYSDSMGNGRRELLLYMRGIFQRHPKITITVTEVKFDNSLESNLKTVTLSVLVGESILPDDHATFLLTFRKKGNWVLTKAEWDEASSNW